MPMKSQAQRGAMHAAAAGKSTLGIPKKVGSEFVASDKGGKLPNKAKQYALPKSKEMKNAKDNC
jgi:hypothetical protein